jgi:hypothetical protein
MSPKRQRVCIQGQLLCVIPKPLKNHHFRRENWKLASLACFFAFASSHAPIGVVGPLHHDQACDVRDSKPLRRQKFRREKRNLASVARFLCSTGSRPDCLLPAPAGSLP